MSLPVIKAKTFDYGNYSRPQQIRYKSAAEGIAKGMQQAGQAIASAVLTSSSIKADAIRAKKKLDEELTIHQDRVLTNVASQLGADFASKNEDIIAKMVDDYIVMPNDSREVRNQKILGFQNEFEKLKSISDYQKRVFRKENNPSQSFIHTGLWARSRHPNYFGEITLWTGIAVIALNTLTGVEYITLISPVFVYILLTRMSGINLLERIADERYGELEEYQRYKRNTPVLFPKLSKDKI